MSFIKVIIINILIFILFYTFFCIIFINIDKGFSKKNSPLDTNTVRSTYPNYRDYDKETALSIFEEYAAPTSSYHSFIAYRRDGFNGKVVNVDAETGFRFSKNHSFNNSVWFFGGSTMWGTGASDDKTIPSYFSDLSGEKVLNLGESGFVTFQESINLQIMLLNGYKPKMVIFYDGVNDSYTYSAKNELPLSHAYTSRYREMIRDYSKYKGNAEDTILAHSLWDILVFKFKKNENKTISFYRSPFDYYIFDKDKKIDTLSTDSKLSDLKVTEQYLQNGENSANLTFSIWLQVYSILKEENIPVLFILQPNAAYRPDSYNLDYLIDTEKQKIINIEKNTYEYYETIKKLTKIKTQENEKLFLDLSEVFMKSKEPIFIDSCHLSPNGNYIIAKEIYEFLK